MILPIKKVLLSAVITLFASCGTYNGKSCHVKDSSFTSSISTPEFTITTATYQTIDLGGWSLDNSAPIPTHECDSTTHTHDFFVTHHEDYDKYVGVCTNNETKNFTSAEAHIYHNDLNFSNPESPSHNVNNHDSISPSHDPLSDSALETRKQGIEENQTAQIEAQNKSFPITGRIIYELNIPKGTILYARDVQGRTFDSTLLLEKTHTIKDLIIALQSPII
jgi:hypothetical protein